MLTITIQSQQNTMSHLVIKDSGVYESRIVQLQMIAKNLEVRRPYNTYLPNRVDIYPYYYNRIHIDSLIDYHHAV